ncbi:MAG: T9SS type A sorting domain-containing protein [Endomicrobia bacterium]|nr:T9SS type A sorting domain-containing protein [Endomicrobiia bacterium]
MTQKIKSLFFLASVVLLIGLLFCGQSYSQSRTRTPETEALLSWLKSVKKPALGSSFSHSSDWTREGILGRSPLVFGYEYYTTNYITKGKTHNDILNNRNSITKSVNQQYALGGVITFQSHMPNFVTYGTPGGDQWDSWDTSVESIISNILPNGDRHEQFNAFLDELAEYFSSFVSQTGQPIPILFRPFHEINGGWFWWGDLPPYGSFTENGQTKRDVVKLWRYTHDYMTQTKGLKNLIWVWNVNVIPGSSQDFLQFFPGKEYVDILSMDIYISTYPDTLLSSSALDRDWKKLEQISASIGNAPIAVAEFGFNHTFALRREPAVWQTKLPAFLDSRNIKPCYFLIWGGDFGPVSSSTTPQEQAEDKNNFREFVLPTGGEPRFLLLTVASTTYNLFSYEGAVIEFPVISRNGVQNIGKMIIPERTFNEDVTIQVKQHNTLAQAESYVRELSHTNIGVRIDAQGKKAEKAIELRIPYNESDITGMNEDTLVIARYDEEKQVWVPLQSKVDKVNKQVTANINHLSVYAIMGTANAVKAFEDVRYYPNPIQPSKGLNYSRMQFSNIPAGTRIKIYTMLGQVVRDLEADASGMAVWDGKNDAGEKVASGVYIVYMKDGSGNKKRIKIAVER